MNRHITGYLIKRLENGDFSNQVINFEDTLQNLYRLLNCELIEMPTRKINGVPYIFIVDEEGTFKENNPINAVSRDGREYLVGNILIVGLADREGNITSLTTTDTLNITKAIRKLGQNTILTYEF